MRNAITTLKSDMWDLITVQHFQWVVAVCALLIGLIALIDGMRFFWLLSCIFISSVVFCFMLSQLRNDWIGKEASITRPLASVEVALFSGIAAYKGWEGTQLLIGFALGIYMLHMIQGLVVIPYIDIADEHSAWKCVVGPLTVLLGTWMVHERCGAGRVLGILAPAFGSSLVVAALSYLWLFACAHPQIGKFVHVVLSPDDVPSVFEFWYMIVYPMHSKAVGYFEAAHHDLVIGNSHSSIDRIISLFCWILLAIISAVFQLRKDRKRRRQVAAAMTSRLLDNDSLAAKQEEVTR